MSPSCCLAGIDPGRVPLFSAVLKTAGVGALATLARLNVSSLGVLCPDLIVCDVDGLDVDRLEFLRRLRFVLPETTIAVYTGRLATDWARSCHLAGANCLLSKDAGERELSSGLRRALTIGAYTDPRFAAA